MSYRCSTAKRPSKVAFAQQMRRNPTPAEKRLWHFIRCKRLGVKFGRQRLVLGYIADFYCPSHRIVIEVDGSSHDNKGSYDAHRNAVMAAQGFLVIRFTNSQVMNNIIAVVHAIRSTINTVAV